MEETKDDFTLPSVFIPRQDIERLKKELITECNNRSGGLEVYKEMVGIISKPANVLFVRYVPGTKRLQVILNILILSTKALPLLVVCLLVFRFWISAILMGLFWYFVLVRSQERVNYEIGARFSALGEKIKKEGRLW